MNYKRYWKQWRFFLFFFAMLDTLIVGYGLAGFHLAWQLKSHNKNFLILSDPSIKGASRSAAGVCNPTVLKRYTLAWQGLAFSKYAEEHYANLEQKLNHNFFHKLPIHRYFFSSAEQNEWYTASQKPGLIHFLKSEIALDAEPTIKRQLGYGIVEQVGRLDIKGLLDHFKQKIAPSSFREASFDYNALQLTPEKIMYQGVTAKRIVFCEGFGLKTNPWFNYLPLLGSKGEYLIIKAPHLITDYLIKGGVFIVPLKADLYWVGATFSPQDKTLHPTEKGKNWLRQKLEDLINVPYEIHTHGAAIRPTVIDRRPLLGAHPQAPNIFVFNGLGTRGVLMAPLLSKWLYEFIEKGKQLPEELSIDRFENYFSTRLEPYA
ncbi:MAG: NAD(P)/FAD-dependent oxidoreductase [Flavobacteriaceae bacterium]